MLKEQVSGGNADHDPDAGWLARIMHITFFALLGASLVRFLLRHPGEARTPWIIAFSVLLALLYVLGPALGARPTPRWMLWLGAVVGVWVVLVLLAPSFTWCAVPLFYTGLRTLPVRPALSLVVLLTGFVVVAQMRLADEFDPNLLVAPPAVAALAVAVFVHMRRQSERLAAIQRREGTLAERQRLAMEIHDTLAQGLSSQRMLLQAADRVWESDPDKARTHVRTAGSFAERNLAEARRFVHDLAPADLAEGGGLAAALTALAERSTTDTLAVRCRIEGPARALPDRVESALLRIAQGALANITEHSGASAAALTLTFLDDQVVLDIADNGRGFDPAGVTPTGVRGHGLPAIRARAGQLGGILTVESAPGEGTVLSAAIPLEHRP
ncbi:sensor histidine kinase [Streptomyces mesophilus]|nr:sensor histidine kinase [Streptomyces mesophilus]